MAEEPNSGDSDGDGVWPETVVDDCNFIPMYVGLINGTEILGMACQIENDLMIFDGFVVAQQLDMENGNIGYALKPLNAFTEERILSYRMDHVITTAVLNDRFTKSYFEFRNRFMIRSLTPTITFELDMSLTNKPVAPMVSTVVN